MTNRILSRDVKVCCLSAWRTKSLMLLPCNLLFSIIIGLCHQTNQNPTNILVALRIFLQPKTWVYQLRDRTVVRDFHTAKEILSSDGCLASAKERKLEFHTRLTEWVVFFQPPTLTYEFSLQQANLGKKGRRSRKRHSLSDLEDRVFDKIDISDKKEKFRNLENEAKQVFVQFHGCSW